MSTSTLVTLQRERIGTRVLTRLLDYVELTKPRILTMALVTVTLSALMATWGQPDLMALIHTLLGATLVAGSASVFNQWLERRPDSKMRRTQDRPIPAGRIGNLEPLIMGWTGVLAGLAYLLNTVGRPAAFWAAMTWLLYVGVYTPLKSRTWMNTIVGAIPGAMPVLIGWTGTGAALDARAWGVFLLVFLWQFPHFMSIAWLYREQYAQAGMQMLTVVDPTGRRAGVQAVAAATSVVLVSFIPATLATAVSPVYILGTLVLGVGQLIAARRFCQLRNDISARRLLRASLLYLPLQLVLITLLSLAVV